MEIFTSRRVLIIYDLQLSNLNSFHESFRLRKTENKVSHPAWLNLIEAEQRKGKRLEDFATNSKILKKFLRAPTKRMAFGLKPFRVGEPFWLVTICQMSHWLLMVIFVLKVFEVKVVKGFSASTPSIIWNFSKSSLMNESWLLGITSSENFSETLNFN